MTQPAFRNFAWLAPTAALALFVACAGGPEPETEPEIVQVAVRAAPPAQPMAPVAPGDCPEALRRAAEKPDLPVDRVASPKTNVATALRGRSMPAAVKNAKYNEVRVTVMVDTLGKPDMKTWTVLKTTNPWLATSLQTAVAKTAFDPAMLAGCKVPRLWLGEFTSGKAPAA